MARRTLLTILGVQLVLALALTLVDSWRRRAQAEAVPDHAAGRGDDRRGHGHDVHLRRRTCTTTCWPRSRAPQQQVLFETYIWKGDEIGERFKQALAEAADRGVEVYAIYDGFANLVVVAAVQAVPAVVKVLRVPRLQRRLAVLRPAPLRPRPPQDPGRRRQGRLRRRLQHRLGLRDRVARHPLPDHRARRVGPEAGLRRLLEPAPARGSGRRPPLLLETASDWEPRIRVHRNVPRLWMFPIRAMYLEAINRASRNIWMTHAYFIPDQDFVDALDRRRAARGRRPAPAAAQVQPHRRRLDLARLLRPAARRRGPDLPVPGRDGARQDRHHRRQLDHGRHRQHRPAEP